MQNICFCLMKHWFLKSQNPKTQKPKSTEEMLEGVGGGGGNVSLGFLLQIWVFGFLGFWAS